MELNESAHAVHSLQSDGSMDPAADLAVDAALFLMELVDRKLHPAAKTPGTGSAEPPAAAADAASRKGMGEGASTAGGPGGGGGQSRPAVITSAAAVLRADEAWGAYVSLLPAHPGSVLDWPPDEVSQGSFGRGTNNAFVSVFIQRIQSSPVLELPSPLRARVSYNNPLLPLDHNHQFFFFVQGVMGMGRQTLVAMPAALSHCPHGHTYFPRAVLPGLPYRAPSLLCRSGSFWPAPRFWPRRRRSSRRPRRRGRSCSLWSWRQRRCGGDCVRL